MSAEESETDGNETENEVESPESSLLTAYRTYIGEPESQRTVYVGFGLFFAGIALGVVGLVAFAYSGVLGSESTIFWQLREFSLVVAMLALPAIAVSITVLLPVGRGTLATSIAGAVIAVVAIAWLTQVYPYEWTDTGNDVLVAGLYAAGLVLLAASTGSALVAQYVDRATLSERDTISRERTDEPDEDESVSDEQVAADIEEAMADAELTWGGVEQEPTTKRLKLNTPSFDQDSESNAETVSATEVRSKSDDVDSAVDGLRRLQGEERKTGSVESPDAQVDALTELREQREAELETGVDTDRGLLQRLRDRLFG